MSFELRKTLTLFIEPQMGTATPFRWQKGSTLLPSAYDPESTLLGSDSLG